MSGEEINAQITAVGEEIRQLKASKADKATIDGKVATDPMSSCAHARWCRSLREALKRAGREFVDAEEAIQRGDGERVRARAQAMARELSLSSYLARGWHVPRRPFCAVLSVRWAAEAAPKEKKAVAAQAVDPNKARRTRRCDTPAHCPASQIYAHQVVDPAVAAAREAKKQQEKEEKAKKEAEKAQRAADRAAPKKEKVQRHLSPAPTCKRPLLRPRAHVYRPRLCGCIYSHHARS